jgi:purine-nucleoside phosphorylase
MKYKRIKEASNFIKSEIGGISTKIAILTGTGMTGVESIGETVVQIPYEDIPYFPAATVQSHAGILYVNKLDNAYILIFSGRFHFYEGYKGKEICFPVYIMKQLGVEHLLMTNASGGLSESFVAGDIVTVSDHINFMGFNPLAGKNDDRLGIRFPDMSNAYDRALRSLVSDIMGEQFKEGVYAAMTGPTLETPAEYKFLKIAGADMVGMSTVPEVIAAVHAGIKTCVLSVISNMCYPIEEISETTIQSVIDVVQSSNPKLVAALKAICQRLA